MLYTPITKTAIKLCFDAHAGQLDRAGLPYVLHPIHLAEQMHTEHETCAALLHDVVEDTEMTFSDLIAAGIPEEYVDTCKLLTHEEGTSYFDYIDALKDDSVARKVKMADLSHNSDPSRLNGEPTEADRERFEKYRSAMVILEETEFVYRQSNGGTLDQNDGLDEWLPGF